jgi:hypothetical protein
MTTGPDTAQHGRGTAVGRTRMPPTTRKTGEPRQRYRLSGRRRWPSDRSARSRGPLGQQLRKWGSRQAAHRLPYRNGVGFRCDCIPLPLRRRRSTARQFAGQAREGSDLVTYLAQLGTVAHVSAGHGRAAGDRAKEHLGYHSPVKPGGCDWRFRRSQPLGALGGR